jgi:hypothetical protein
MVVAEAEADQHRAADPDRLQLLQRPPALHDLRDLLAQPRIVAVIPFRHWNPSSLARFRAPVHHVHLAAAASCTASIFTTSTPARASRADAPRAARWFTGGPQTVRRTRGYFTMASTDPEVTGW